MPGLMTIDASNAITAMNIIKSSATATKSVLEVALDATTRQYIKILKSHTPVGAKVDSRNPTRLRNSYHYRSNAGGREVYISPVHSAFKFMYVTEGTAAHIILPRNKKALSWPGIAHPVAYAYHKGTKANPFHKAAEAEFNRSADEKITKVIAEGIVNAVTETIDANCQKIGFSGGGSGGNLAGALGGILGGGTMAAGLVVGVIMQTLAPLLNLADEESE
jgi:hypothetical protein